MQCWPGTGAMRNWSSKVAKTFTFFQGKTIHLEVDILSFKGRTFHPVFHLVGDPFVTPLGGISMAIVEQGWQRTPGTHTCHTSDAGVGVPPRHARLQNVSLPCHEMRAKWASIHRVHNQGNTSWETNGVHLWQLRCTRSQLCPVNLWLHSMLLPAMVGERAHHQLSGQLV